MFESVATTTTTWSAYGPYLVALLAIWLVFGLVGRRAAKPASVMPSLDTPAVPISLHPMIDPGLCIGCAACTHACPEGDIIGLVGNKAELLDPSSCIGHGACKTACPTSAITLVFGSAKRGVDIPQVAPDFQSNVPGLYIAGELGGMGLIANAIEQGCSAIASISLREDLGRSNQLDVVIIGGGPAGFAASLAAKDKGLRSVTLEQGSLGGTVAHYPRGKLVMTRPASLPLYGAFKVREISKEDLLGLWQSIFDTARPEIRFDERVDRITKTSDGFSVTTADGMYETRTVLLATGRRGAPRRLDVPGENLPKVVYALVDAAQYRDRDMLVVGGGLSAVEAALDLTAQPGARVTLSYRSATFDRVGVAAAKRLADAEGRGALTIVRKSTVKTITSRSVELAVDGESRTLPNDGVIVCAGGQLPLALLRDVGVLVETKYGTM